MDYLIVFAVLMTPIMMIYFIVKKTNKKHEEKKVYLDFETAKFTPVMLPPEVNLDNVALFRKTGLKPSVPGAKPKYGMLRARDYDPPAPSCAAISIPDVLPDFSSGSDPSPSFEGGGGDFGGAGASGGWDGPDVSSSVDMSSDNGGDIGGGNSCGGGGSSD